MGLPTMSVAAALTKGNLGHLIANFHDFSLQRFKSLLLQDYDAHGVTDVGDKQALFRLIQSLNDDDLAPSPEPGGAPADVLSLCDLEGDGAGGAGDLPGMSSGGGGGLMDLDGGADDDDDFLADGDGSFSPVDLLRGTTFVAPPGGGGGAPDGAPGGAAAPGAPPPGPPGAEPPKIRVIVRKRPLNAREAERGEYDVLEVDAPASTIYVNEPKTKVDLTRYVERHAFRFDDVFGEGVDNEALYAAAIQPLVGTLFRRGKGTVFAYGQTGSGKTFTMGPLPERAARDIFAVLAQPEYRAAGFTLWSSCYEIYGGKVFDLLNSRRRLDVREDARRRVQVVGLHEVQVDDLRTLRQLGEHAAGHRSTGQTGANDESSRSHSIMTFSLRLPAPPPARGTAAAMPGAPPPAPRTVGRLAFIDLAGSERGADTYDNDKQTRLEGAEINKSLLALKECIRALDADARHVPFRGSKLTEVLRDSFVGANARTVMIGCVSPNSASCEHTLNTLRYADRVKEMRKPPPGEGGAPSGSAAAASAGAAPSGDSGRAPAAAAAAAAGRPRQPPAAEPARPPPPSGKFMPTPAAPAAPAPAANGHGHHHHRGGRHHHRGAGGDADAAGPRSPGGAKRGSAAARAAGAASEENSALAALAGADEEESVRLLEEAEVALLAAHQAGIEATMADVRREMDLLARLDGGGAPGGGGDIEAYCDALAALLAARGAATAALARQVDEYRRMLDAAVERYGRG